MNRSKLLDFESVSFFHDFPESMLTLLYLTQESVTHDRGMVRIPVSIAHDIRSKSLDERDSAYLQRK